MAQVMTFKDSHMHRILQVMHNVAQKSFTRACQVFCIPLGEKVTCCSAQTLQPKTDKKTQDPPQNPPSTILILNISNSTLVNCVIGDSYSCAAAERPPPVQQCELHKPGQVTCCCGQQGAALSAPPLPPLPPGEHLNISIHSSSLNCVIIGDNNYMHTEQNEPFI